MGIIIVLFILVIALFVILYGSVFFIAGIAYGYCVLSIGMAPVLWLLMGIGAIVGFVCAIKNAIKAIREMHRKGVK